MQLSLYPDSFPLSQVTQYIFALKTRCWVHDGFIYDGIVYYGSDVYGDKWDKKREVHHDSYNALLGCLIMQAGYGDNRQMVWACVKYIP